MKRERMEMNRKRGGGKERDKARARVREKKSTFCERENSRIERNSSFVLNKPFGV